jgi:hypothetical protein
MGCMIEGGHAAYHVIYDLRIGSTFLFVSLTGGGTGSDLQILRQSSG